MPAYARANIGSFRRRLLEEVERAAQPGLAALLEEERPRRYRSYACRSSRAPRRRRAGERDGVAELWRDGGHDRGRNLILHLEEICRLALEHVGPERRSVGDVDEPRRHAQSVSLALDGAPSSTVDVERLPDLLGVSALSRAPTTPPRAPTLAVRGIRERGGDLAPSSLPRSRRRSCRR